MTELIRTELDNYSPDCLCVNLNLLLLLSSVFFVSFIYLTKLICCRRRPKNPKNDEPKPEYQTPNTNAPIITTSLRTQSTSPIKFLLPSSPNIEKCNETKILPIPVLPTTISSTSTSTSTSHQHQHQQSPNCNLLTQDDDLVVNRFINQAKEEELLGNVRESLEMITLAISLLPTKSKLYETRCHLFRQIGLYEEALKDANILLERCPSSESLALIGEILLQMGKKKESETRFIEGINLNKDCPKCNEGLHKIRTLQASDLVKRADEEFNNNNYENSAILYTQAISLMPSEELYEKRAITLGRQGLYKQAQADWTRAEEFKRELGRKRSAEELERPSKYTRL